MSGTNPPPEPSRLRQVAEIAVGTCAAVQPGEKLLVLTDTRGDPQLAEEMAQAGRRRGAEVVLLTFDHVDSITSIPARVAQAMAASDVVIPLCRSRILYSDAVRDMRQRGRVLYMADVSTELFLRPVVLDADYEELGRFADAFSSILAGDHVLRVSSGAGTSATMRMRADRDLALSVCRARQKGDHDYLPGGAWFGCPDERSVNGTFVLDCSMEPGVARGILHDPVAVTYRDGWLVGIEGGSQADEFRAWIDSRDEQIRGFSHNGGGFNCAASRVGNLMEDERILGAFNIAGGNNTLGWPGTNTSTSHFDGMMSAISLWLDDVPVVEGGRFVHPALVAASSASRG